MSNLLTPVENQFYAYNAHDLAAFSVNFSEDFIAYRMPSLEPSIVGKMQLEAFYRTQRFNKAELRAELISRSVLGNKVFDYERIYGLSAEPIESVAIFEVVESLIVTAWFFYK
ncbi:nuclear transport factor 2 family protein [Yersinia nurmii]|uniref:Nuclear transport factor 2 family protein n=1 Tax=Yersinia nurmii TaxID=685706 RepID=A0AAW7K774_9GAMM|nr:nuclear transport factor 2 family protein [Yersinia nurmii]MDN0087245.1 nuclear transport factor 2 family protein [Yersinia nurmii]CNE98938.1 Uncharacterized conserved protein [Yersinia nurmii]